MHECGTVGVGKVTMQRTVGLLSATRLGWIGFETPTCQAIIQNSGTRRVLPLDTIDSSLYCRISWDLGCCSPSGFNNQAANSELAYSMYMDDFHPDDLPRAVWNQLHRLNLIISKDEL